MREEIREVDGPLMGYYTTSQASRVMKLTRQHIAHLCRKGELPGAALVGHTWLIPFDAVENYIPGPKGFAACPRQ